MHQSKLLELLRTFSPRQRSQFREFLESPYFNRAADAAAFYDYLAPYAPAFAHAALSKAAVRNQFKPGEPLTEKRLAYLMNQLHGLAEEFVAVEAFRTDPLKKALARIETYASAGLPRHLRAALEQAAGGLEQFPYRNADYYAENYRLTALHYWQSDQIQHQHNPDLQHASDALDTFFLVEKLRYCLTMAHTENTLNLKYEWGLGAQLIDWENTDPATLNPTQQVYLTGILLARHPDDTAWYHRQKALLLEHDGRFNENERKLLYTGLLNYCSQRINRYNDQTFFAEYFELNKTLLERGLLFEDGQLSPLRYLNLVNSGLQTAQTEWTERFIRQYRDRLPAPYATDAYLMAMGRYHFHLGDYAPAQVALSQVNPLNPQMAVMARNLLARIYYETGETELLLAFLEAYRVYLLRQELLNPQMKQQARRFVDFTRRLAKIDRPEAHLLPKLRAELPPATEIYHRDWLLEQIERKMRQFGPGA